MRKIKFRGKRANGEFVFGSYCCEVYCDIAKLHVIIDERGEEFSIDSNSVDQLVGYDANGNEVYEGDRLTDADGNEHVARLESVTQNPDTAELHFWAYPSQLKLKENQHVED